MAGKFTLIWWLDSKDTSIIPITSVLPKKHRHVNAIVKLVWKGQPEKLQAKIMAISGILNYINVQWNNFHWTSSLMNSIQSSSASSELLSNNNQPLNTASDSSLNPLPPSN
ncbi:hypothetical protein PV325_013242, partial [Microctonus aethiopoides]